MFSRKIQSLCIALFCLCAAVPQMAFAEYPEHPVTVYHPFEPTPYDALSKVYNAEMSKILGVPFVFEYGMMGKAAKATLTGKPDGYTVYFAAMGPMVLKPSMVGPSASPKDFRAVGRATLLPILFVANKNAPFKTFEEFRDYAKAHPGKARIGITNAPSSLQIGMTHLIKDLAKLDVELVEQPDGPVRGTIDCLIGDTDALISHPPDIMRYIKRARVFVRAGDVRANASLCCLMPTLRELGYDFSQMCSACPRGEQGYSGRHCEKLAKASGAGAPQPGHEESPPRRITKFSPGCEARADAFLQSRLIFDLVMSMGCTIPSGLRSTAWCSILRKRLSSLYGGELFLWATSFHVWGLHLGPFGFVRRLTTASGRVRKSSATYAGWCFGACLAVPERAPSVLPEAALPLTTKHTAGPR